MSGDHKFFSTFPHNFVHLKNTAIFQDEWTNYEYYLKQQKTTKNQDFTFEITTNYKKKKNNNFIQNFDNKKKMQTMNDVEIIRQCFHQTYHRVAKNLPHVTYLQKCLPFHQM